MPNPFIPGTNEYVDYEIWNIGQPGKTKELDFLRALHSKDSLKLIKNELSKNYPGLTRVSSIWIDKYPLCIPKNHPCKIHPTKGSGRRELGDLAVIFRQIQKNGAYSMRMWILQGKINQKNWINAQNSTREICLYECCPDFDLYETQHTSSKLLGTFTLSKDFGKPPAFLANPNPPFWSYLLFEQSSTTTNSPITLQWPSSGTCQNSFISGLKSMTTMLGNNQFDFGADVHKLSPYHEWRRLFWALLINANHKKSNVLPNGSWINQQYTYKDFLPVKNMAFDNSTGFGTNSLKFRHSASEQRALKR